MSGPQFPPGACDTHMHIYDSRYPTAASSLLRPPDATVGDYRQVQAGLGLQRVVVVHQPVAVTRTEDMPNLLRGHAAALQRWAAAGADLVMGGHIHLPYVMALQGMARPMWAVQAGTAVSSRVRKGVPNSVNLLRWGEDSAPGCCRIEQWDFSADVGAFVRARVSEVRPAGA